MGGYFFGRAVDGTVARRLDRDHSGSLELLEIMRFLYPQMGLLDVQKSIVSFEKKYKMMVKRTTSLVVDSLSIDQLNDFARVFARQDPDFTGMIGIEGFRSVARPPAEIVSHADIDAMFLRTCKVDKAGRQYMDFECFVAALYVKPFQKIMPPARSNRTPQSHALTPAATPQSRPLCTNVTLVE